MNLDDTYDDQEIIQRIRKYALTVPEPDHRSGHTSPDRRDEELDGESVPPCVPASET